MSGGQGGIGSGRGNDSENTGPHGKIHNVKDIAKSPTVVGESGTIFSAGETSGAPDSAEAATVPYTDVLSDYKKSAEKAMTKEKIPPAYKSRVKEYFKSLE